MIGYINGSPGSFFTVYTYGEMVLRDPYYIEWVPSSGVSGTFYIDGSSYNLADYGGYFSDFDGVITSSAFNNISGLRTIYTNAYEIEEYAFKNCSNLSVFYVMNSSTVLQNSNAFDGTDITNYAGSILVPYSAESSFLTASQWSYFSNVISAWHGYEITWAPTDLSGTFTINGLTYRFEEFSNAAFFDFSGIITSSAFKSTSGLTNLQVFALEMQEDVCRDCMSLLYFTAYSVSTIGSGAFRDCYDLRQVNLPDCISIGEYAFYNCLSLTYISVPFLKYVGPWALAYCGFGWTNPSVSNVMSLPECKYIGSCAFYNSPYLKLVDAPECIHIGSSAFMNCSSLSMFDLNECMFIGESAFYNCPELKKFILRGDSVCSLMSSTAFQSTPIESGDGLIYVKGSLLSDYRTAAGWSYYSNKITPYDMYYIDWTPAGLSTGNFSIGGSTYNFSDYNGIFTGFSGIITSGAFSNNTDLTYVGTNATELKNSVFQSCRNISSVSLPVCLSIGSSAFRDTGLVSVNLPVCGHLGSHAFRGCTSLTYVNLPVCSSIEDGVFRGCTSLSTVVLTACGYIGQNTFYGCNVLSEIDLPVCSGIRVAFQSCSSLSIITLRSESVCSLVDSGVFNDTLIGVGTGYIKVPSSLVSEYKVAQNWSDYASRIVQITS